MTDTNEITCIIADLCRLAGKSKIDGRTDDAVELWDIAARLEDLDGGSDLEVALRKLAYLGQVADAKGD